LESFCDIPMALSILHTAPSSCKKRPGEGRDIRRLMIDDFSDRVANVKFVFNLCLSHT
jgi:hypothetical protein